MRRRWRLYPIDETCKLYLSMYKYGGEVGSVMPDASTTHNDGTINGCVPTSYPMLQPVASGSVTQANMKISAVNGGGTASGGAFMDFSLASVLTDYLNHLLVIKDSSGRVIQGYIKAVGAGETLSGTELITNGVDFTGTPDNWGPTNCTLAAIAGGEAGNCLEITRTDGTYQEVGQNPLLIANIALGLHKFTIYQKDGSVVGGNNSYHIFIGNTGTLLKATGNIPTTALWAQKSLYVTAPTNTLGIALFKQSSTVGTTLMDTVSLQRILTPSATGVTIVSAKDGATYNWLSKDANFNYNDTSNYTYAIYSVPGYMGLGWFGDGVDDRIVHSSLNLGTTHTLHYWLLYQGISGVIHGGAANYHGLRLTPTACGYNVGTTEVTVTHSASIGQPVLFSIDRNGTSVDFYQNGVKIGTTQTLLANTAQVLTDLFRYSDGTSYWNGILFDAVNINTNKGAQEVRNFFELTRSKYGV